ncbi:MAG: M20 family metallo-hydrolase [Candidatus Thermoplasmatota archaeon]|nr:M20 family metallo-hydrolase [Candidatus Thermoplasmatota archaeon]
MEKEELMEKIESYRENMIRAQVDMCAIKAISPDCGGEGEFDKAEYVKKLVSFADEIREYDANDKRAKNGIRPNIVAKVYGRDRSKAIWIMSHLDVVPEGERSLWNSDPFKAVVKDGKLYGRGVEDNQQAIVSSIFAAKTFKDLGIKPKYDINLLFVSDEEMGSEYGVQFLLKEHGELFNKDDIYMVPDSGSPKGDEIEIAEKTILWIKFAVEGKQSHASMPDKGINAHRAGADLLLTLDKALHEKYNAKDDLFSPPVSTFEPTKKEANVPNVNTIPGKDVFYFDCRVLPQYDPEDLLKDVRDVVNEIEKKYGVKISVDFPQKGERTPVTDPDSEGVKLLKRAINDVYGVEAKTIGIGGGTVAAYLRAAGCNACVWATIDELAHQPNEYCVIDHLVGDAKVFATLAFE